MFQKPHFISNFEFGVVQSWGSNIHERFVVQNGKKIIIFHISWIFFNRSIFTTVQLEKNFCNLGTNVFIMVFNVTIYYIY